jgi:hypothetical protein
MFTFYQTTQVLYRILNGKSRKKWRKLDNFKILVALCGRSAAKIPMLKVPTSFVGIYRDFFEKNANCCLAVVGTATWLASPVKSSANPSRSVAQILACR